MVFPVPSVVSNALVYFGNISYSVYLVHWPLLILAKYLNVFTGYYIFILTFCIFGLGIVQYTLFEKSLSKQSEKLIYLTVLLLNIASFILLQNTISDFLSNSENAVERNEQLFGQCRREIQNQFTCNKTSFHWKQNQTFSEFACDYNGTGNLTVLLAGNSYAMRIYQSLLDSGRHTFRRLVVITANTCVIHKKLTVRSKYCRDVADNLPLTLAELKPDIVIIHQRMFEIPALRHPLIDPHNDRAMAMLRKDWAMISNYTKKIIIVEPAGGLPPEQDILKPLRLNEADLSVYAVPLEQYKAEVDPGWDRVLKSINNCPKCKAVGIRDHFCDDKSCAVYDTESRMSLYCDVNHHAPTAVKRYMPSIVREIEL